MDRRKKRQSVFYSVGSPDMPTLRQLKVLQTKVHSHLDHVCKLDIDRDVPGHRMTGLVCTIGPSCDSVRQLMQMLDMGMNVCRLNLAHGSYEYHALVIKNIREALSQMKTICHVAIAIDISGPGIRLGKLRIDLGKRVHLERGHIMKLTTDLRFKDVGTPECMFVDNVDLINHTQIGSRIYLENGPLCIVVKERAPDFVICVVETEGELSNRIFCNMPGILPGKPQLTPKDKCDLVFGMTHDVDIVFASYIWHPDMIVEIKQELFSKPHIKVIGKIANKEGCKRIDDILEVSDGIMLSRGNLGIDIPPEKVFLAQKMIIGKSNKAGKPIIVATQMLDSMTKNPRPTRAEAGDVANAILDGADCVMLTKETASGKHPLAAVKTLAAITVEADGVIYHQRLFRELRAETGVTNDTMCTTAVAAVEASFKSEASAIVVVTATGRSAALISMFKPKCIILAITRDYHTANTLHLHRGVLPILYEGSTEQEWVVDIEDRIDKAISVGIQRGYLQIGDMVVFVTGWKAGKGSTNTIRVVSVPDPDLKSRIPLIALEEHDDAIDF